MTKPWTQQHWLFLLNVYSSIVPFMIQDNYKIDERSWKIKSRQYTEMILNDNDNYLSDSIKCEGIFWFNYKFSNSYDQNRITLGPFIYDFRITQGRRGSWETRHLFFFYRNSIDKPGRPGGGFINLEFHATS